MSDSENSYNSREKKEINEKLHDITGSKYPEKIRKGPSILKYILGFFINWAKLPFQLKFRQDSVVLPAEVKKLDENLMYVREDHTFAYFKDDLTDHDTRHQLVNHAMYMFLTPMDESIYNAAMKFVYTNIHGGLTLTNGISWPDGSPHYHGDNVSTETLALMTLMAPYSPSLLIKYEQLILNIINNGGYLNYLSDPNPVDGKYQKALEKAMYVRENVKMENPATNMFPGCSADAAVVKLAALAVAGKSSGSKRIKRLFKLYYYLFGYGLKARFSSNSLQAITALYVLFKVTKEEKYKDILMKKFGATNYLADLDSAFKRYLYGQLVK